MGEFAMRMAAERRVKELDARVASLRTALLDARDAIASLPEDALGHAGVQIGFDEQRWPIRAELLAKIDAALQQ